MPKHLIIPILALALSFSADAQKTYTRLKVGFAMDYEHIQAPSDYNIGSGSGWGGSMLFRLPLSQHLELDWSLDIAGGHVRYSYTPYTPYIMPPYYTSPSPVEASRSFSYVGIPLHLVYSHSFDQVRVFAGAGLSLSIISMPEISFHGWALGPDCNTLTASFKAGLELYRHIILSGEFRPWKTDLTHNRYPDARYKVTNFASVKLGYEFQLPKHSSRSRSHT